MNTYDHTAFQVSDLDHAILFYTNKLGFALASRAVNAEEQEAYAFLTLGDVRLELIQDLKHTSYAKPTVQPPYCPHLAIETTDMPQAVARLNENGVTILRGPLRILLRSRQQHLGVHSVVPEEGERLIGQADR
jgi:catechol 2,3-dioxygenase-like lactoylglutathione lyase family enzyme